MLRSLQQSGVWPARGRALRLGQRLLLSLHLADSAVSRSHGASFNSRDRHEGEADQRLRGPRDPGRALLEPRNAAPKRRTRTHQAQAPELHERAHWRRTGRRDTGVERILASSSKGPRSRPKGSCTRARWPTITTTTTASSNRLTAAARATCFDSAIGSRSASLRVDLDRRELDFRLASEAHEPDDSPANPSELEFGFRERRHVPAGKKPPSRGPGRFSEKRGKRPKTRTHRVERRNASRPGCAGRMKIL